MNIIIKRTQSIKHFVEGHLYIDEKLICDTLENSRSCLSSGIYAIRIMETSNHLDFWIHVSCRRDPKLNRHHVVYYMKKN